MSEMASTTMDIGRPPSLVEGFDSVWLLDSQLTAEHWKYLWQRFDVRELIDIGRRSGWLSSDNNRDSVLALLRKSRAAGYDPLADGLSADEPVKEV
jgi:hypothetical protein